MNARAELVAQDEPRQSDATAIIQVIERAAMNPAVDIDKMERLLAMQERIIERTAKAAFLGALADMQPKLPVIGRRGRIDVPAKDGRTGHSTPYALWEDINEAIRPLLAEHGFALSFRVGMAGDGRLTVTGVLGHREGHSEETTITLMHDSTGSKNAVQAVGSSTSYGKRYTAMALLNITSRGEDDDGQLGGDAPKISQKDVENLVALADIAGADKAKFCQYFKVASFADIPQSRLKEASDELERKRVAKVRERAQ